MPFPKPVFSDAAIAAAKAHAVARWPEESCGVIVGGNYIPCENIAENKQNDWLIDNEVIITAGKNLQAVIHSHTNGNRAPSAADMQSQIDTGCIFGLILCNKDQAGDVVWWGDFLLEENLIGRKFIHGISDCYSLVRAYFWQVKQIKLPDWPRDDAWWEKNENLYVENFQRLGFTIINRSEVTVGDCFIGKVRSPVPNHGGIIQERGLGLHHLDGRYSRREPIARWDKFITHYLRYGG